MVTIKDIAREAGVSHATVSCVLNGKAKQLRISDVASERVKAAADQLGYQRNEIARSVVTGKTNVIGFLVPDTSSEHCARLLDGIMRGAYENDYFIKVIYTEPGCSAQDISRICIGQRLAGLIAYGLSDENFFSKLQQQIAKHEIPLAIAAGNCSTFDKCIRVLSNHAQGGRLAFKHLYDQGHRSFIIAAGYCKSEWAAKRTAGFVAAAAEAGITIPEANVHRADEMILFEQNELKKWVAETGATALFCMSDYSALTAINTLQLAGLKVPEDVAVAGYGNLSLCNFSRPAITSIEEHLSQIGSRTVNVLLEKIKSGNIIELNEEYSETLNVELITRNSTNFKR
ncbi:MAG: LacI family DNA-binding transcriptional regulator [Victivallaceae bacterium]|jgi:LacI family transcriptional regulator